MTAQARKEGEAEWKPAKVGDSFGPLWTIYNFKIKVTIPNSAEYSGKTIHLRWESGGECLVKDSKTGRHICAFAADALKGRDFLLLREGNSEQREFCFDIEMGCYHLFGGGDGLIQPPDEGKFCEVFSKLILPPDESRMC
eukprot:gene22463-1328_t